MIPKNNEIYRHFKGNLYKVITLATHSETGEQMVVYQALYGECAVYCRPLPMFVSEVDREKYPEATQKLRFEPVDSLLSVEANEVQGEFSKESQPVLEKTEECPKQKDEKCDAKADCSHMAEEEETLEVDPLILEFLDAETISQKKNILTALHHRITDEMINTLAVVLDVVIEEGELEDRYYQLKNCLETKERYEIERKI